MLVHKCIKCGKIFKFSSMPGATGSRCTECRGQLIWIGNQEVSLVDPSRKGQMKEYARKLIVEKEGSSSNRRRVLESIGGATISEIVYIIAKLCRKEKLALNEALAFAIGGAYLPQAFRNIHREKEMQPQAEIADVLRGIRALDLSRIPVQPAQIATPTFKRETPTSPVGASPEIVETNLRSYTWFDVLLQGSVVLVIGKSGSGKSAFGYFLLERFQHRASCYVINLPKHVHHLLPPGIGVYPSLEDAPLDSVLLMDEAAAQFSSRMSSSEKNRKLLEIVRLARQRKQIIIFICQDASYLDITVLKGLSTLIIKEPAPLQVLVDRPELKEFIQKAKGKFENTEEDKRTRAYIAFSPCGYEGMVVVEKPSFFTDELSRCYAISHQESEERKVPVLSKEEKKQKAYQWYLGGDMPIRQMARRLGVSKSTAWNWIKEKEKEVRQANEIISQFLSEVGHIEGN